MRPGSSHSLRCLVLLAVLAVAVPLGAQAQSQITNVKDLKAEMYTEMSFSGGADACVRLLHANGTIGCATPGRGAAEGRLQRLDALLPSPDGYPGTAWGWWVGGAQHVPSSCAQLLPCRGL